MDDTLTEIMLARWLFIACWVLAGQTLAFADSRTSQPEVTIISPLPGAEFSTRLINVEVALTLPVGENLIALRALIDGSVSAELRDIALTTTSSPVIKAGQLVRTLNVPVPRRDCLLSVHAQTQKGESPSALVQLRWSGPSAELEPSSTYQPRLYVLAIGVARYQQPGLSLNFPGKDAWELANAFQRQAGGLYSRVTVRVLIDELASKSLIQHGLRWLQQQVTAQDVAVLFLAGHGINDPASGQYYFLPHEADLQSISQTMISQEEIRTALQRIPGKVLFFLDSCHSGDVLPTLRGIPSNSAFISELSKSENGVVVFAASTGLQYSQESLKWRNGAFTRAAVEGLEGKAAYVKDRPITVSMLDLYISERVKELTGGAQTPTTTKSSKAPDFPIALAVVPKTAPAPAPVAPARPPLPPKPPTSPPGGGS